MLSRRLKAVKVELPDRRYTVSRRFNKQAAWEHGVAREARFFRFEVRQGKVAMSSANHTAHADGAGAPSGPSGDGDSIPRGPTPGGTGRRDRPEIGPFCVDWALPGYEVTVE